LALIVGFNDKQPTLIFSYWLINFLKIFLFVVISLGLHVYLQKVLAKKYGCTASFDLWKIQRISFRKKLKLKRALTNYTITSIPLGVILSVLVYILSSGQIFFTAITSLNIEINKAYRIGKRYVQLTNFESAKIAVIGPLVNIALALLSTAMNLSPQFTLINLTLAISYMLPLPGIDGGTIFFGSKPLYVASAAFIGITVILMNLLSIASTIAIAAIFSIIALVIYLKHE
jgi:Zn-dependent protease